MAYYGTSVRKGKVIHGDPSDPKTKTTPTKAAAAAAPKEQTIMLSSPFQYGDSRPPVQKQVQAVATKHAVGEAPKPTPTKHIKSVNVTTKVYSDQTVEATQARVTTQTKPQQIKSGQTVDIKLDLIPKGEGTRYLLLNEQGIPTKISDTPFQHYPVNIAQAEQPVYPTRVTTQDTEYKRRNIPTSMRNLETQIRKPYDKSEDTVVAYLPEADIQTGAFDVFLERTKRLKPSDSVFYKIAEPFAEQLSEITPPAMRTMGEDRIIGTEEQYTDYLATAGARAGAGSVATHILGAGIQMLPAAAQTSIGVAGVGLTTATVAVGGEDTLKRILTDPFTMGLVYSGLPSFSKSYSSYTEQPEEPDPYKIESKVGVTRKAGSTYRAKFKTTGKINDDYIVKAHGTTTVSQRPLKEGVFGSDKYTKWLDEKTLYAKGSSHAGSRIEGYVEKQTFFGTKRYPFAGEGSHTGIPIKGGIERQFGFGRMESATGTKTAGVTITDKIDKSFLTDGRVRGDFHVQGFGSTTPDSSQHYLYNVRGTANVRDFSKGLTDFDKFLMQQSGVDPKAFKIYEYGDVGQRLGTFRTHKTLTQIEKVISTQPKPTSKEIAGGGIDLKQISKNAAVTTSKRKAANILSDNQRTAYIGADTQTATQPAYGYDKAFQTGEQNVYESRALIKSISSKRTLPKLPTLASEPQLSAAAGGVTFDVGSLAAGVIPVKTASGFTLGGLGIGVLTSSFAKVNQQAAVKAGYKSRDLTRTSQLTGARTTARTSSRSIANSTTKAAAKALGLSEANTLAVGLAKDLPQAGTLAGSKSTSKTRTKTSSVVKPIAISGLILPVPPPPIPPVPIIPPIDLGFNLDFGGTKGRKTKFKPRVRTPKYKPSVRAIDLGITATSLEGVVGAFGTRPILVKKKRKTRRKKK